MKYLSLLLIFLPTVAFGFGSFNNQKTVYSTDQNGMNTGRRTCSGNRCDFYNQNGMRTGYAIRQGNIIYFYDQNGMSTGQQRAN